METGFPADNCSAWHGTGRTWKIEESKSDYSLWKHQEPVKLDETRASFLKLLSNCHGALTFSMGT